MKALTWHGPRDVRVDNVADPEIQESTDAIIRVTSSGICGSDLHLYEVMSPFLEQGDILGHEPMGVVEETGSEATNLSPGDRVVIPFQISCGECFMCNLGLHRPSARPPRSRSRVWEPHCSATQSSTARWPEGRPSTCASPRPTTPT